MSSKSGGLADVIPCMLPSFLRGSQQRFCASLRLSITFVIFSILIFYFIFMEIVIETYINDLSCTAFVIFRFDFRRVKGEGE